MTDDHNRQVDDLIAVGRVFLDKHQRIARMITPRSTLRRLRWAALGR